jgi:N-acetylglucosamine-6-sulfatase
VPPGWDEWYTAPNQNVYDYELNENGTLVSYGTSRKDFKQDVFSRRASQLISEYAGSGSPLYLQLDYTAPHAAGPDPNPRPPGDCARTAKPAPRHAGKFDDEPLPLSPSFDERDVRDKPDNIRRRDRVNGRETAAITRQYRCQLESLLSVDEGVARVIRSLKKNGILDNTFVVFTSDNGYFHGEHRLTEGKRLAYEEAVRLPLIVRGPGVPRGVEVQEMTINADLAPTIVELADAPAGLTPDGHSLLGALEEPDLESGRELLIEAPRYKAIRTARYFWVEHRNGDRELYDMSRDPFQLESLHDKGRTLRIRERLATRLASLAACAGQSCLFRPELEPELEAGEGGSCVEPRVRASFAGADKSEIERAEFFADGKLVKLDRRKPFTYEFTRRDLGRERSTVLLRATLIDGRRASWDARLRLC